MLAPGLAAATFVAACDGPVGRDVDTSVETGIEGAAERPVDGRAAAGPADDAVPFRLVGPNDVALLVPVHLNGAGPYSFVLDTGATLTCIDDALARELELPQTRERAFGTGVGGPGPMSLARADSVRVGGASAFDLTVCALDLGQLQRLPGMDIDGLLGLNFLRNFRVTLDFQQEMIRLDRPG